MATTTKKKRSRSRSRSREKPAFKKGKNDIYVDYKNGSIEVNEKNLMKINEFRDLLTGKIVEQSNAGEIVTTQQQMLNYLDSIKDGANSVTLQQLNIYPKVNALPELGYKIPQYPIDLHAYENNIKTAVHSFIYQITWTKLKKKSELDKPIPFDKIFRDCGIGPDVFVAQGFSLVNNFAQYMDPATRGSPAEVWPPPGQTIEFSNTFMYLFGLVQSSIKATTKTKTSFVYDIVSNGASFTYNGSGPDPNLIYFSGNTNKNKILKESGDNDKKKALISLKEWGDKMQVLFLMVWASLNKGKTYSLITCDKVVYTLCLLLNIVCVFTGEIKEKVGKATVRKYSIEVFQPSKDPLKDTEKRFEKIKTEIIKENKAFIDMIVLLEKNPEQEIFVDGVTESFAFHKDFYTFVLEKLKEIQQDLEDANLVLNTYMDEPTKISNIENRIKFIKQNYLFTVFIRKIGSQKKIKMLRGNSYTLMKKSGKSFLDIAKTYSFQTFRGGAVKRGRSLSRSRSRSLSRSRSRSSKTKKKMKSEVLDSEVFKNSDFSYHEVSYMDKDTGKIIDLNVELDKSILESMTSMKYPNELYDSVKNYLLMDAYVNNGISVDKNDMKNKVRYYITNYITTTDTKSLTKGSAFGSRMGTQKPFIMGPQTPSVNRSILVSANGGRKTSPKTRKKRI